MTTLVMKFGGTSTASPEALKNAAGIVSAQYGEWDRLVVVVSAMAGVTDLLLECACYTQSGQEEHVSALICALRDRISSVVRAEFPNHQDQIHLINLLEARLAELTSICQRIQVQRHTNPRELDQVAALGERINVHIFSSLLCRHGVPAQPVDAAGLIVTDDRYQSATPIKSATNALLASVLSPLFARGIVPVITGFIGATSSGVTTTLGRGGSDYTAAILAESLHANEVWIWTDVDGIMTSDPCLVSGARLIPEIAYHEVSQLAQFGAKVVHPKTIQPVANRDIPLWVRNTFNPSCPGTRICQRPSTEDYRVSAVTGLFNISLITFQVMPLVNPANIGASLAAELSKQGFPPLAVLPWKGGRSVSFAYPREKSSKAIQTIEELQAMISHKPVFSQPRVAHELSLITLVGWEISRSPGILSDVTDTLIKGKVRIIQVSDGGSPHSLVLVVPEEDGIYAQKELHEQVILSGIFATPIATPAVQHAAAD